MTFSTASAKVGTVRLRPVTNSALARQEVEDALLAGFGEADVGPGAESEVARASVHADALTPRLGEVAAGGALDPEGESAGAAAVAVASGFRCGCDKARGESVGSFDHGFRIPVGISWPHRVCGNWGSLWRSRRKRCSTVTLRKTNILKEHHGTLRNTVKPAKDLRRTARGAAASQ